MHGQGDSGMIERSTEYRRIKRLTDWDLVVSDQIFYLVVVDDSDLDVGIICFHPVPYETGLLMHAALGEKCRGARAAQAYNDAFDWIFSHTDETILRGRIPDHYRHAHVMAVHCGGRFEEIDRDSLRCYKLTKQDFYQRERSDDRAVA